MNETITADQSGLDDPGTWTPSGDRYELRDELARGGGGRIVIALDRKLDRIVAVKLPLETPGSAARLMREAHLVARLEHPSIVPVHDFGCDEDGRPFYVMKLLGGTTLQAQFDNRSFDDRIALLPIVVAVADATAYAHSRGVIHRDLKPSNVLVGEFGEVAVIDWGLARLTAGPDPGEPPVALGDEPAPASGSRLTLSGAIVGTPAYMPPEQARAEVVDARVDVYALGAILYHLLAGRLPYPAADPAAALDLLLAGPPDDLAAAEPRVPADLAAIVGKAMAREIDARYRDARELAEDLRRYQAGRLVLAHRYSPWLRVRRGIRRHRAAVAAAAIVVAGAAAVAVAWPEARPDARAMCATTAHAVDAVWSPFVRAAVMHRILATGAGGAAAVARQVADRFERYAGSLAAARVDACEATYVRGARTAALYDERFACFDRRGEDLAATVRLFDRIPDGQLDALARATRALPELASCSDDAYLRDSALPADKAARDRVFALQKRVAQVRALDRSSQFPAALDAASRIVADPGAAAFRPLLAEARQAQGHALEHLGDGRAAEAALLAAIADADASRADHIRAQAMVDLAVVHLDLAHPDDAERVLRALEAVAARVGSKYLEAGRLSGLSRVASARGDHAAAVEHARRALETWQSTGDPDLDTLSDFQAAVGKAYAIAQRPGDAEQHFRAALELSESAFGPDHDQVGIGLGNLANILQATRRAQESIPLYRRALEILARTRGKDHAMVLATRQNLAGALNAIKDYDGALREFLSLLPAMEKTAPDSELHGKLLHNLGLNRKDAGDDAAAERYFRRSLAHAERTHHDHLIAQALWGIGSVQLRAGRARDALPLFERALALDAARLGPTTEAVSQIQLALGRALLALGRPAVAIAHLEAALPYAEHGLPPGELAEVRFDLGRALVDGGGDRAHGLALVEAAGATFDQLHDAVRLAQVARWRAHGPRHE